MESRKSIERKATVKIKKSSDQLVRSTIIWLFKALRPGFLALLKL